MDRKIDSYVCVSMHTYIQGVPPISPLKRHVLLPTPAPPLSPEVLANWAPRRHFLRRPLRYCLRRWRYRWGREATSAGGGGARVRGGATWPCVWARPLCRWCAAKKKKHISMTTTPNTVITSLLNIYRYLYLYMNSDKLNVATWPCV